MDSEWLSIGVSIILPVAMAVVGWLFTRIVGRIDAIEKKVSDAFERDANQNARIESLEKNTLTREDLRDVMESALQKSTAPITTELKAISISSQETRERLVRLEASFEISKEK